MRHAYVGDVGDFGKYGLLRALLQNQPSRRLGVIWYLTNSDEHNNDGRHDGYLKRGTKRQLASFRDCDRALYDMLRRMRTRRRLNLRLIERGSVLPADTCFYNSAVPVANWRLRRNGKESWMQARTEWFVNAAHCVSQADIVFLDPDNGVILPNSGVNKAEAFCGWKPSHKHAYWNELALLLNRRQSLIAYHHLGRQRGGHLQQIRGLVESIARLGHESRAIHYRRGSARAFFIIPGSKRHREWLFRSAANFADRWSAHCAMIS